MVPVARDPTRIANKVAALLFKLRVLKPGPPHLDRPARQRPKATLKPTLAAIANDLQLIGVKLA
jgi:hypothetical protein